MDKYDVTLFFPLHQVPKLYQTVVMIISRPYFALAFYFCGRRESQDWDIIVLRNLRLEAKESGVTDTRTGAEISFACMNASELRHPAKKFVEILS